MLYPILGLLNSPINLISKIFDFNCLEFTPTVMDDLLILFMDWIWSRCNTRFLALNLAPAARFYFKATLLILEKRMHEIIF
jgi:hypothetical protein